MNPVAEVCAFMGLALSIIGSVWHVSNKLGQMSAKLDYVAEQVHDARGLAERVATLEVKVNQ